MSTKVTVKKRSPSYKSGAQRRKLARAKLAKSSFGAGAQPKVPHPGGNGMKQPQRMRMDLIAKLPKRLPSPGELDSIDGIQREWQRVHRLHWRKQITDSEYSGLMYGLQTGTGITKIRDELARVKEELAHARAVEAARLAYMNPPDLSQLTDDEMLQLETLLAKAQPAGARERITFDAAATNWRGTMVAADDDEATE
jgi:hypothetical protein